MAVPVPAAAPPAPSEITESLFQEWTHTCGVRRVQREFEKLGEEAHHHGRSIQEELKSLGYKDFHQFSKKCPQFPLTCWPTEFAELGSGYVMYFHFVAFLAGVLLLLFLIQIPSMALYSKASGQREWQWNDWHTAFSTDPNACNCIGDNAGLFGPVGQSVSNTSYGKFCSPWDLSLCPPGTRAGAGCAFDRPSKWVCRSWCFASPRCSTRTASPRSMTNRHYGGTYVRSYSACPQDQVLASCGTLEVDMAFDENGTDAGSGSYVGTSWLTPGNYGPDEAAGALIPSLFTTCIFVLCGLIFMAYQHQIITDIRVDADIIAPNDYAILVRGLPATATDEKAIKHFFQENAVRGKTDTEIVKVVIGWDAQEFRDKIREMKQLRAQLDGLQPGDLQMATLKAQIAKIQSDLATAAPDQASRLMSSGVVVVVFRYQSDLRACLKRWTGFWASYFNCDADDSCLLPVGNGVWKGPELPRFPIGSPPVPVHALSVDRAPNPGDIMWEELGVDWITRWKMFAKTNGIMVLLVAATFGVTYGFNKLQETLKDASSKGTSGSNFGIQLLSILPALCVAIMNSLVVVAARLLAVKEYHETWTEQEFSQAIKMTAGMVVNTAGIMYFMNAQPTEWYKVGGLVNSVFTMLVINALMPPLIPYLDLGYRIRGRTRKNLTTEKLSGFNDVIKRGPPKTPVEAEELSQVKREIELFKRAFAPSPLNDARRYATALKTFICCLYYMPLLPWVAALGSLGLALQYGVDKYLLLRWYKRPEKPANSYMAKLSMKSIKVVGPIGLTVAFYVFLTPSWANKDEVLSNFVISIIISVCFPFLPLGIWAKGFLKLSCVGYCKIGDQEEDYYKAQYMWSTEMKYHKDQFIYKCLPPTKNPEFLQPDMDTSIKLDDVKATYGMATEKVAEEAGGGGIDPKMTLKGGKVIGTPSMPGGSFGTLAAGATAPAATPAPTTYGVKLHPAPAEPLPTSTGYAVPTPTTSVIVTGRIVSDTSAAVLPASAPDPGYVPGGLSGLVATTVRPGDAAVVWEYEVNHGYTPFASDCQSFIERKYQEFKAGGGRDQVNVKTSGIHVSVNFGKMTTKKDGSHKIRDIRRRETE